MLFNNHYHNHTIVKKEPDTVNHHHGPVTITEHRAPTDESIKIMKEMEQKVLENIISSIRSEDNYLNAAAFLVRDNLMGNWNIHVKYTYNKHQRVVKYSFDFLDIKQGMDYIILKTKEAIAEDIAQVIVNSTLFDIYRDLQNIVNEAR
jgi:hypothetical protein